MYDPNFLSYTQAHELFGYDEVSGFVIRKTTRGGQLKGTRAGYVHRDHDGRYYRRETITVDGLRYDVAEHRLIVLLMTGEWPTHTVDHINGNGCDNRWINLRCATQQHNMWNMRLPKHNTSGHINVSFDKARGKYCVAMRRNGAPRFFKRTDTYEEACKLQEWAVREYRNGICFRGVADVQHDQAEIPTIQFRLPQSLSLTGGFVSGD